MANARAHILRTAVVAMAVALLPATAAGATTSRAGAPASRAAATQSRYDADRTYAVGTRTLTLVDTSRPTPANRTAPALPSRTLVTALFYPAAGPADAPDAPDAKPATGGKFPLIVFSHGFGANGPIYSFLLRRIAAEGYVVAAPTFPLSSAGAPGGPALGDYVNQPADVRFVIDEVLRRDRNKRDPLGGRIARNRIGVAGHSLGAITTLGLLNSCCGDRRIDAAVPISGAELPFPGGVHDHATRTPLLLIHGDADGTVPYAASYQAFAGARPPKFLLTLLGGGHVPFFGPSGEALVGSMIDFLDRYVAGHHSALGRLLVDGTVPGVSALVAQPR